jgi:hypothetical protein
MAFAVRLLPAACFSLKAAGNKRTAKAVKLDKAFSAESCPKKKPKTGR